MTHFRMSLLKTPWTIEDNQSRTCSICKKYWQPWVGSYLPCHGKCLFTEEGTRLIRSDPRTEAAMARAFGVSFSVIRAVRRSRNKQGDQNE